jgi:hypothetical protein
MRFWFQGEDEDYTRECERVRQVGGVPPAPISLGLMATLVLLVSLHLVALTGAISFFLLD